MSVTRRDFLKITVAGSAAATGLMRAREAHGAGGKARPNVLFIITDQQPVSTIGAYGNDMARTPNLDRLCGEGLRFDRFHISAFPCSPSRACFFTGQYSHNHGVVQNDILLRDEIPSMGNLFKAAGYQTAYIGKWHLGGNMYAESEQDRWSWHRLADPERYKFDKTGPWRGGEDLPQCGFTDKWVGGWTHYRGYIRDVGLGELLEKCRRLGNHNIAPSCGEGKHMYSLVPEEHHMSAFLAGEAEKFIREERDPNKPFCMVLSFYGPHLPVAPPKPWDEMFDPAKVPLPDNHDDKLEGKPFGQRRNWRCYRLPEWTDMQFRDYVARYWGYCAYIDRQVGRVLKALDDNKLADDTIVVFTSDHGDMVAAHGMIWKLGSCGYDELLRVPFILRYPGSIAGGRAVTALVESVDVLPTLLSLCGLKVPQTVEGKGFGALLRGETSEHREVTRCSWATTGLVVATDRWKYTCQWARRDLDELYDLRERPLEMNNRARDPACGETAQKMKNHVRAWTTGTNHPYRKRIGEVLDTDPFEGMGEMTPQVTAFSRRDEKGRTFADFQVKWLIKKTPQSDLKYWCFLHVKPDRLGPKPILTRKVLWPEVPTTEWKNGTEQELGTMDVPIPDDLKPGKYGIWIGLYNPDKKEQAPVAGGLPVMVGKLTVRKERGKFELDFTPQDQ